MQKIIHADHIQKNYKDVKAVDNISLSVNEGEIFGMVGPNGAGKTTTIECLEGLRNLDSGSISVLGKNPYSDRKQLQTLVGVQLQETRFQDRIKVRELCELFSSFYTKPLDYQALLERFGLQEKVKSYVSQLSGGQRQKLSIVLALLPDPRIVFLDELTTGLDPRARRNMWNTVKGLQGEGRTIFLTTHYMEEAENLCDRLAVVDQGKIIALGTIPELIMASPIKQKIVFTASGVKPASLEKINGVHSVEMFGDEIAVYSEKVGLEEQLRKTLAGKEIRNLRTFKPNLEDVFLELTAQEQDKSNE